MRDADIEPCVLTIWRGRATGDYWAMPPPGHPAVRELINSTDISELARRLAEAEGRHGL